MGNWILCLTTFSVVLPPSFQWWPWSGYWSAELAIGKNRWMEWWARPSWNPLVPLHLSALSCNHMTFREVGLTSALQVTSKFVILLCSHLATQREGKSFWCGQLGTAPTSSSLCSHYAYIYQTNLCPPYYSDLFCAILLQSCPLQRVDIYWINVTFVPQRRLRLLIRTLQPCLASPINLSYFPVTLFCALYLAFIVYISLVFHLWGLCFYL